MIQLTVYIDNFSTAPIFPEVVEAVSSASVDYPANPSSSIHPQGRGAASQVDNAREKISRIINCSPREIVFTSGATESNNIAITGTARALARESSRRTVLVSAMEHSAVLEPAFSLTEEGFNVKRIACGQDGIVDISSLQSNLTEDVMLVSVMMVNNEIGTIQPITEISSLAHSIGAVVHSDCAQALGKVPVDVRSMDVDLMSMSAHKMGGPKGVGALYLRSGPTNFPISPITIGGGHESGLRPGTLNTPGIVGFSEACELSSSISGDVWSELEKLRNEIERGLVQRIPGIRINCQDSPRVPGGSNFTIPGVDAEMMVANLDDIVISTGSACKSGAPSPACSGGHRDLEGGLILHPQILFGPDNLGAWRWPSRSGGFRRR